MRMFRKPPPLAVPLVVVPLVVVLLAVAPLAAPAAAQFDLLAWTQVENPSYPSTNVTVNGDTLTVAGPTYPDPCFAPGADGYAVTIAPFDATVTARLLFVPDDSVAGLDMPMYVINGVKHALPESCTNCEVVFHVHAGDTFGFGNHSVDCLFTYAVSTWSGLRLLPEPHAKKVTGPAAFAAFGQSVASIGDVDLDGVPDVAVGAPHASVPATNAGRVVVLSGADASVLFAVNGQAGGLLFGFAVAGAGDVNGDGIPDVLVGAPDASFAGSLSGRFYVLSGAGGALLVARDGDGPGAHYGFSVAGPGDVNGDGTPDLLVGAPGSGMFGPGAGRAALLSGSNGAALLQISGVDVVQCGFAVAATGDLSGDGLNDVLVGSPHASPGGVLQAGLVRAVSGASGEVLLVLRGDQAGAQLGSSVAGLGDLDGDGVPDIAAGEPYVDAAPLDQVGRALVFSGGDGALLHALTGSAASELLGWSVAAAGDVDADGAADVLVGAIGLGSPGPGAGGTARILSGRDGSLLALFAGAATGDELGAAVAGAGDLDGDGQPDAVIGAPDSDLPASNAGAVLFFTGIHALWSDLGGGIAGALGTPTLKGKSLLAAAGPLTLSVGNAAPGAPLTLVLGFTELGAPYKGGVLWPQPDVLLGGLAANAAGNLSLVGTWPAGVPSGFTLLLQAWIKDGAAAQGFAATNGLRALTP